MIQDYNEYKLNNKERIALIAISAGFLLIAGFLYINSFITVVISPIAYGFLSQRYISYIVVKRKTKLRNEFKELLYSFTLGRSCFKEHDRRFTAIFRGI